MAVKTKTSTKKVKDAVETIDKAVKKFKIKENSLIISEEKVKGTIKVVARFKKESTQIAQEVIAKAARFKEIDAQMKLMKTELDEIKEFFKNELKNQSLDALLAENYKINYSESDSMGFDKDAFIAKYGEKVYNRYLTKPSHSEKVTITRGN